jgi:autotransporter-associated beta strand protein
MSYQRAGEGALCRAIGLGWLITAAILLFDASFSEAANLYWNVASGDWSDAANWGGVEPTSSDNAYIQNGGTANVTQAGEVSSFLCLGGDDSGTVQMSDGLLTTLYTYVGLTGVGTFNQSAGRHQLLSSLTLGSSPDGQGTYNLSGTGELYATMDEYIGLSGTGTFIHTAGTNTVNVWLYLGYDAGSNGTYYLTGGTLIVRQIVKGAGTAAFNFGGGTIQASGNLSTSMPMTLTGIGGNAKIDTAGYSITLSGLLSGPGGLNKLGLGTLTLTQNATYNGNTTVEEGTLDVLKINTPSAAVSVGAGANQLTAVSIVSNSLTVGAGAKVVIKPISDEPQSSTLTPVPEPSTFVLLTSALILLALNWIKKRQG